MAVGFQMTNFGMIFLLSALGFIISLIATPKVGNYMRSIGKVGNDVFKKDRPEVAESGGMGFMVTFLFLMFISLFLVDNVVVRNKILISLVILVIVTIIGIIDDFRGLSAKMKPLLLVLAALPVFFLRNIQGVPVATPNPVLPFVGPANITIVYWGLAIFVIAVPANASNMLDVMNGVMSGSGLLILATAFLATFLLPLGSVFSADSIYYVRLTSLLLFGSLLGFWWYNRYPASIFAGDTGSLGVGATIGLIAIYGQIEFVMVVALLVHIMNSFSIISSVGGLRERREMRERPVKVEDGIIYASRHPSAPITMVRLLAARAPTTEDKIIKHLLTLVAFCCLLALISAFLIRVEVLA
ncbi:MAG: hypothetical protein ACXAE3_02635 [Candidatus Kariarchaeaceae archaeon]